MASAQSVINVPVAEKGSYGQILKSSALIGGSSIVSIAMGIVRTKAMAVLLGPSGVGLAGLYGSISDLTFSVAGMGINNSGVRQIAQAAASNDTQRVARTAAVLRRTAIALGILGALILLAFSTQISVVTFGTEQRRFAVMLLSAAVLLRLISSGQEALINGMRRIGDLARVTILAALLGTIITITLVYFFRENGVVPGLVAVSASMLAMSWWYGRQIPIQKPALTVSQVSGEAGMLLKLGLAFMASGLMVMGTAYIVRIILLRNNGFEATGLYQSAWTLGGLYVGFILQAMGADFYPRLTASANDHVECNRLVNEQARIGLLLAGPGAIATLTLAPLVIALFYSSKFGGAVEVLRWICLGAALRVINWPMGFILLAKGKQALFFWSELAWTTVHLSLAWVCVHQFGVNGAGMAFFGSYIFHGLMIYFIVSQLTGFRWSKENLRAGVLFLFLITLVFSLFFVLPFFFAVALGTLAAFASGAYSTRELLTLMSLDHLPSPIGRLLARVGLAPARAY